MKKTISILLSFLLCGALIPTVAGCAERNAGEQSHIDESTLHGIDKEDPYTWFEADKETLPSREQCLEILVNMRLNEVMKKLGKPQRDVGYGASLFQFDVADGSVFTVTFTSDPSQAADLPAYDRLVVEAVTFDLGIPELYFPQQTVLCKLYPWMEGLNVESLSEVRRESAFIGVAPYRNLITISYSTDKTDLASACLLFSSPLHAIPQSEGQIDGGSYVKYDFVTSEETYSVTVCNHTVFVDGQYYSFGGDLIEFASPDLNCHAFLTYTDDAFEVLKYGEEDPIGTFRGIGALEFQEDGGSSAPAPRYVVKREGDIELLILSSKLFRIEGERNQTVYRITGEKDFSELFSDSE